MTATLVIPATHPIDTPRRPPAVPRVTTSVLLSAATVASLAPSLLPRAPEVQAVVTALFAATALLLSAVLHRITTRLHCRGPQPTARRVAASVGIVAVAGAVVAAAHWQNRLRDAMGQPPTGAMHWVEVLCGSVSISAMLIVAGVGSARGVRAVGTARVTVAALVVVVVGSVFAVPWARHAFSTRYTLADAVVDTDLAAPNTASRIRWDDLGREGRRFVAAGADGSAIRTYVGLRSAATVDERARLAVDELGRAGGFGKEHIVIAVPTGSGWVDENAVSGIEERFADDVATVALQYSDQPSWATFLFAEDAAVDATTALLNAVRDRLRTYDPLSRPELHVYGQSLGSVAGSAAVHRDSSFVCSTVWAGPPSGEVTAGGGVVLANSSDPVVWWSADLIHERPDLTDARVDAPVPAWIPVVSYLQTTVDLLSALNAPAGHGHRYGTDQGTSIREC